MWNKLAFVILALAASELTGCSSVPDAINPISWYRNVTGASADDNLGKGQNQQNLNEGSNEPYPNLANVPGPPDTQLSGVDRKKLVDSLIADRRNAEYSAQNLRAGEVDTAVPPAPPLPSGAKTPRVTASIGGAPRAAAPPRAAPKPGPVAASTLPAASGTRAPNSAAAPGAKTASAASHPPQRGTEAPPVESSLESPTMPNLPQAEKATSAPPPPRIPRPNEMASAAPPAAATRVAPPRAPMEPASVPANAAATASPSGPTEPGRIAEVSFTPGSAYLSRTLRSTIAKIVKLHKEQGGRIRIVGYGKASGKNAGVTGLTLALDRAQAVAVALTNSGVPAKDIAVEAAPVPDRGGADAPRAEIYLER